MRVLKIFAGIVLRSQLTYLLFIFLNGQTCQLDVKSSEYKGVARNFCLWVQNVPCTFTTQAMLCAVYAMTVCLCLSQVGVLLKRLNIGTRKQFHTIAQGL